jgi:hypothetical protein
MTVHDQKSRIRWRERSRVPRMTGRWPDGIRFEDADVPVEGFFKGAERELSGIWPESNLATVGRIVARR